MILAAEARTVVRRKRMKRRCIPSGLSAFQLFRRSSCIRLLSFAFPLAAGMTLHLPRLAGIVLLACLLSQLLGCIPQGLLAWQVVHLGQSQLLGLVLSALVLL